MSTSASRLRSAWVEVDLRALAGNLQRIRAELPADVRILFVAKDGAYGLGAVPAVQTALAHGASQLAVFTLDEADELRTAGITAPILLLGERLPEELPHVLDLSLEPCVGRLEIARELGQRAMQRGSRIPIHIKINTGMNRFGFNWRDTAQWAAELARIPGLEFAGALSHFAQSDELEKGFARVQRQRFEDGVAQLRALDIQPRQIHQCNSGGYLDLPDAHFDTVRIGLLAQGVYPSAVCRRLPGLQSVMSVKARIAALQDLEPGDTVGYGMRWTAARRSRIGVLALGYGDGYPRLRNEGQVLVHGRRVPLVGGVTMDALMIDLTDLPEAGPGDEAVLMGRQGEEEISAHDLAQWKRSVSYDVLTGWRRRLPRVYLGA